MSNKKTRSPLQVTGNSKPQNEKIFKAGCLNWYSVFFVPIVGLEPTMLIKRRFYRPLSVRSLTTGNSRICPRSGRLKILNRNLSEKQDSNLRNHVPKTCGIGRYPIFRICYQVNLTCDYVGFTTLRSRKA